VHNKVYIFCCWLAGCAGWLRGAGWLCWMAALRWLRCAGWLRWLAGYAGWLAALADSDGFPK